MNYVVSRLPKHYLLAFRLGNACFKEWTQLELQFIKIANVMLSKER